MSCTIAHGRLDGCKDNVGGLKAIYFVNKGDVTWTVSDETITGTSETTPNAFKYELRGGGSNFDQSLTSDKAAGTTFATQTLVVNLKKIDATTNKEIKALTYGTPHAIVEDNNGDFWVLGEEYGLDTVANTVSGSTLAEKTGYELTLTGEEKGLAKQYTGVVATDFTVKADQL